MFTRRHYKAIAEVLRANRPRKLPSYVPVYQQRKQQACHNHHRCIVDELIHLFTQDNSRFDSNKFLDACGEEQPLTDRGVCGILLTWRMG